MPPRLFRWFAALLLAVPCLAVHAAERPNILILLADDLGYNDLRANSGLDMPTTHLDRLANEGVRFTRFYADSTCQPARVALLSGRYPQRAGFRPVGRGIPPEWTTLPEALQALGYATHHVGKWHMGYDTPQAWPTAQGFDTSLGFLHQWFLKGPVSAGHFPLTGPTYENPWLMDTAGHSQQYQGHLTDILAAHTVQLIRDADRSKPWFIYHAFLAPHTPLQPAERYRSRYPDTKAGQYRALVNQMDDAVGSILDALQQSGQADNTIVIFASDNGGTNRTMDNNNFAGEKGEYEEGGVRTFLLWRWPGHMRPQVTDSAVSILDIYPTLLSLLGQTPTQAVDGLPVFGRDGQVQSHHRPLFWESYSGEANAYSVLDADGRWRYVHDAARKLYDVQDAANSGRNQWWRVWDWYPLQQQYLQWRDETRRMEVQFKADDAAGHGRVTGDRLQRTPGVGGFTFAIGLHPDTKAPGWQTVAEQPGVFTLEYNARAGLRGEINGLPIEAKTLPPTACLAVTVTGFWYVPSILWGGEPDSSAHLFVNGEELSVRKGKFRYVAENIFNEPTFIGQRADGSQRFAGALGKPQFFNTQAVSSSDVRVLDVGEVGKGVCP